MKPQTSLSLMGVDLSGVASTLRTHLPFPAQLEQCVPLAGDASNRRYYRLHLSMAPVSSVILMKLADPEGFKASEEAVSGAGGDVTELPFTNILKHLQKNGVQVPMLYFYDESCGLLYLEDFGDVTLAQAWQESTPAIGEDLYCKAVDQLVRLHLQASHPSSVPCVALTRSFDVPLYLWEFDHFLEYGIVAREGPMRVDDQVPVCEEFQKMAEWLASQPPVFTHRDYHSRNLMVDGERLGVIDFQDALMGPVTYDLASLLRDSYIALDEGVIDRLIIRYVEAMRQNLSFSQQSAMLFHDPEAFRRLFDFTSIQRNLKAAGRFVYIDRVKGNSRFLASIPHTLKNVRANLEKYPQLHRLLTHLSPYISEWR
ncbi:aminoglycoside phosphotransferase family protein [Candidatus Nitrospira allomarina]|uniref:Phosphotransferase n=1 Tax=Candidatus Nitrospira allomarina TaxID=3020900 RepID=A0AA96GEL9_9BACT|nr:phosphotransferase [Candidatus Nitrospira allomarina]WNM59762.1 phosphotransferase [Candidatus Nitrospira allomarina]